MNRDGTRTLRRLRAGLEPSLDVGPGRFRAAGPGRFRAAGLLGVGLILGLAACGDHGEPAWQDAEGYRWRPLEFSRRGDPGFTPLVARRTGIDFQNTASPEQIQRNEHLLAGSGVALGDVDGDDRVDIYLARLDGPNVLYRNLGGWRFEEVGAVAGVAAPGRFSTGATFADVEGDGDLDLLVTALGGPNALYLNDGVGRFRAATEAAGLASERGSMTITLADVEGDGDLDLYIANYKAVSAEDLIPPWERSYADIVQDPDGEPRVAPRFREHYRIVQLPEHEIVAYAQRAEPDWFYLNDGMGRFEPVSWTAGRFLDHEGRPLAEAPDLFGLAARFYDVDSDGDPDLYVCNDFEDPDLFWINQGDGRFRAIEPTAVRATSNACMAVDFADIDRDRDVDWFELDMLSRDPVRRRTQKASHTALPELPGQIENRPQRQRNTLFLNRDDGTFAQIAAYAGVDASEWSWSTLFLDVDLDGYEDLLVGNGHELNVQDLDADLLARNAFQSIAAGRSEMNWREVRFLYPDLHARNLAFRNRGDLTFEEVGKAWRFALEPDVSHGLAAGDLDGDGDLDLVLNRLGSRAAVLRNEAPAPRVAVRLRGEPPNTGGVGARIRVLGGAVPIQEREVTAGGLYLSGSDLQQTFAAGAAEELVIEVDWPGGKRSVVSDARPDRLYEIRESGADARAVAGPGRGGPVAPGRVRGPAPGGEGASQGGGLGRAGTLFVDASDEVTHDHSDARYDDFARQPLLPDRLSQLGPGVAWFDADADGDEDLFVASGAGGRLAGFRNEGGRLRPADLGLPEAEHDFTAVLGFPGADGSARSLLVGVSSWEAASPAEAGAIPAALRLALAGGVRIGTADSLPGGRGSTGPLALADVDGDGDLDLFIGARAVPGAYPAAAASRLFRNEGGELVLDDEWTAALRAIGMVSGALFSDVDGDADSDLLLALEWGPIRLLRNDGDRFEEASAEWGLEELTGRWNGITAGDLNGDGRLDLVATNRGLNVEVRPQAGRPLQVFYGDFDGNRSIDVLLAQLEDRGKGGGLYPVEHPLRLGRALPTAARRFAHFSDFARATLGEVIGRDPAGARQLGAATYAHHLFLNRGGRFEAVPLPVEAQLAPAFYAGVADFDGDGHEDLLLSQNFFPTWTETPRQDAGRGLLLQGDGRGGLHPVPGQLSGISVYGDQRGAAYADYDRDGRTDLVVSQNGAATRLLRNVGARPGLRVRLEGPPANPDAVGAVMWLLRPDGRGPAREVHAGSGYWSQNGPVQVLGGVEGATAVRVRWPDGAESEMPIQAGVREITLRRTRS